MYGPLFTPRTLSARSLQKERNSGSLDVESELGPSPRILKVIIYGFIMYSCGFHAADLHSYLNIVGKIRLIFIDRTTSYI